MAREYPFGISSPASRRTDEYALADQTVTVWDELYRSWNSSAGRRSAGSWDRIWNETHNREEITPAMISNVIEEVEAALPSFDSVPKEEITASMYEHQMLREKLLRTLEEMKSWAVTEEERSDLTDSQRDRICQRMTYYITEVGETFTKIAYNVRDHANDLKVNALQPNREISEER